MQNLVKQFSECPNTAWHLFEELSDWKSREEVANKLQGGDYGNGYAAFSEKYRNKMNSYIKDEFYENVLFNEEAMASLIQKYQLDGNIDVDFLKPSCLGILDYAKIKYCMVKIFINCYIDNININP